MMMSVIKPATLKFQRSLRPVLLIVYVRSVAAQRSSRRRSATMMSCHRSPMHRRLRTIVRDPFTFRQPGPRHGAVRRCERSQRADRTDRERQ